MERALGPGADPLKVRAWRQAAREVLQAMGSDIAFVISNGHFVDRMKGIFFEALRRFWLLAGAFWNEELDEGLIREFELEAPIFPELGLP